MRRGASAYVIGVALVGLPVGGCGPSPTPSPDSSALSSAETRPVVTPTSPPPELPKPSADAPVTAAAWVEPAAPASRAGDMELHVRARIAPLHYLHSPDAQAPFTPTSVELTPADWITPAGEWELLSMPDARGHLMDVVEFRRRMRLSEAVRPGRYEVECALKYQACTDELCWPPRVLKLKAPLDFEAAGH